MGVGTADVECLEEVSVELDKAAVVVVVVGGDVEVVVTKSDRLVIVVLVGFSDVMGPVVELLARVENEVVVAFTPVEGDDVEDVSMTVDVQEDEVELEFEMIGTPPVEVITPPVDSVVITLDVTIARGVDETVSPVV